MLLKPWTVPSCVRHATFQVWGAGGNGNGACHVIDVIIPSQLAVEHMQVGIHKQMQVVHTECVQAEFIDV